MEDRYLVVYVWWLYFTEAIITLRVGYIPVIHDKNRFTEEVCVCIVHTSKHRYVHGVTMNQKILKIYDVIGVNLSLRLAHLRAEVINIGSLSERTLPQDQALWELQASPQFTLLGCLKFMYHNCICVYLNLKYNDENEGSSSVLVSKCNLFIVTAVHACVCLGYTVLY